jgi:hypothetical protein
MEQMELCGDVDAKELELKFKERVYVGKWGTFPTESAYVGKMGHVYYGKYICREMGHVCFDGVECGGK